jgi:drug/metabolite transporter (DMT)-like permease
MGLALLAFAPWLVWKGPEPRARLQLAALGAVQFGLMYTAYTRAFAYLAAHEVALATILTPLYVTLLDDVLDRRLRPRFLGAAALSVTGTAVAIGVDRLGGAWTGLALLQASNVCFAVGQVGYRRVLARSAAAGQGGAAAMAWAYVGGAAVTAVAAAPHLSALPAIPGEAWLALAWLGLVASALCFFLWNAGGRAVNGGVLAVMNDAKIPLGIAGSLVVFGETADVPRLAGGAALIAAAWWIAWRAREAPVPAVAPMPGAE